MSRVSQSMLQYSRTLITQTPNGNISWSQQEFKLADSIVYHPLTICHIEPKFLQIFETVLIVFIFLNSTISNLFTLDNLKSTNREGCISMRFTLTLSLFCRLSVVNIVTYSVLKKRKLFKLIFSQEHIFPTVWVKIRNLLYKSLHQ